MSSPHPRRLVLRATAVLSILGAATLQAATLEVTTVDDTLDGPACSLRAAILAADADAPVGGCPPGDPGLDTIELPAGVFTLDLSDAPPAATCGPDGDEPCPPEDEDLGETGDLDVEGPVEIVGTGRAATIVQSAAGLGGDPARVLEILDGGTATLRDLTIQHGRPLPGEPGAGIAVGLGATLELTDCLVADNETDGSGGGVYAGPRSSVTVERCELRDNVGFGGGLSGLSASVTLRASLVAGNRAPTSGGGGGLALVAGEATVERSEIADNLADDSRWGGGGILALGGRVTVRASTLAGNSATDALDDGSVSDLELDETGGGGLAAFSAEVRLESSTISGNRADESRWGGGGVLSLFSDVRIAHSTFRDNRADLAVAPGGSLSALGPGDALGSFTVAHSILDAASPAECGALYPSPDPAPAGTANLVADASCGASIDSPGPVTGLDPLLADAGGPTRTHRLLDGSNAIDAGPPACTGVDGLPLVSDQRGVARPQGSACDLGAVERTAPQGPIVLDSFQVTSDADDPSVSGETVTVRWSATGSAGAPTGTVTVTDGASAASCSDAVDSGSCDLALPTAGGRTLTASYSGDATYAAAVDTEAHQVDRAATRTTITGFLPVSPRLGYPLRVFVSVEAVAPGTGAPTGEVTIADGSGATCAASVAVGFCDLIPMAEGERVFVAGYEGDGDYLPSDSSPAAIEVLAPPVEIPTLGTLGSIALSLLLGWVALRRVSPG